MSKIHFKFKSSKEYDSITFDGIQLSLDDVRKYIYNKRNLSSTEFDLQIVNAQNNEEYTDGSEMILKNTSVIVSRIPVGGIATESLVTPKEKEATKEEPVAPDITLDKLKKTKGDLPMAIGMMEEEKLKDAIQKSTSMYDPTTFRTKYGKPVPIGDPGKSYICNKCGKSGHWIQNCPEKEAIPKSEYRLGAGIPLQHLKLVADPNAPGAVLTREGYFGVTVVDAEAYENQKKKQQVPRLPEPEEPVPEQLCCSICKELAKGAITTPCCKEMTCDKCFCDALITDERTCPLCKKKNVSPAGIEANKYIRREVMLFRSGQPRPSTDVKRVMGTDSASASPRSDTGSAQASPLYEEPSREEPAKLSTTDTTAVSTAAPVSVPDVIVPVVATVAESSSSTSQTSISASSSAPSLIAPTRPLLGTAPPNVAPSASTFSLTAPTLPFNNYGQATYTAPVPMMPPVVHRPPPQPLYDPSNIAMAQAAAALVAAANAPRHSFIPNVPVVNPPPLSEEEFYRRQRKERRAANPAERRSTSPSRDRRSPPRDRRSPREGRSPPGDRRSPTRPRSPSKEKDPLAAWNAFINRGNSPKRAKKSSRSPRRSCSPKHSRDNRSPDQSSMKRRKSLSPRRHSRSPRRRLSRSPYRRKSISPGGRYSRSPRRRPSLSPGRRYSPDRRQSPSHSRRPRRSPLGRRAVEPRRSPGRWDSPRSVSRSPYRSPQRSPVHSPVRRTYPSGTSPYRGRVRSPYYDTFDTPPSRERSRRDYHSPHNRSISPRSKFRPLSPRQRSPWRPPIDITDYNRTYYHSQGQSNSPGRHWSPSRRSISPRECQSPPTDRQFVRSPHRKPPSKRALSPHSRSSKLKGGCSPKHKSPGRLSSSKTTAVESPSRARVAVTSSNQSVSGTRLSPTPRNDKPQSLKDTLPAAKTAHDSERSQRSKPLRGTSPRTQSKDSRNVDEKSKESPEDKEASGSVGKSKEVIERSNKTMELGKHSKEPIEKTKENLTAGADTNEKLESRGKVKSKSSKVEGGESSDIKGVSPVNKKDVSSDQKSKKNQAVPEKSTSSANAESRKSRYRDGRDKIRSTSRTAWSDSSSSVSLSPPPQPDSPIKLPPRSHNRQLSPRRFSPHHRQYSSKVDQRRPSPPRTYHRRSSPDQMRSKWYSQTRSKSPSSRNVMNKPPATYEEWWYSMMKQFSGVGPGNSYPEMYNRYMQMYSQQFQARPPPVPLMQLSTSADYRRSDDYSDTRTLDKHVRGRFEQSRDHDYRKDRSKYDYEIDASRRERRKRTRTPSKSSSDEKLAVYEAKKKKKAKKDKKKKDKKKKKSRKMSRDSSPIDTNAPNLEVVVKVSDAQTLDLSDNPSDEQPPGRSLSRQEPPKKYSASPEPKKCSPQPKSQRKSSDESANDARETSLTREEHSDVEIDSTSIEKTQKGVEPSDAPKRKEQSGPVESLESSIVEAQTPSDQLNDTKSDNISSKRQSSNTVEEHYLKNANVEEPNRRVDLKSQAESGDHKKTFLSSTERKKDAPSSKVAAKIKSFVASNAVAEKERKESAKKPVFKPSRDFSQRKPIRISAIKKESLTSKLKKTDAVPVREIKPRRNSLNDFDDLPDTTLDIPLTASDEEIKPPAQGILNEDVKKKKRKKDKKKKDKKKKHQRKSSQSEEDNVPSAIERHIVIGGKSSKRKLAVSVPNDNASSKRSKNIPNDLEDARHRITSLRTQSRKSSVEEVKSKSAVWRRVKLS